MRRVLPFLLAPSLALAPLLLAATPVHADGKKAAYSAKSRRHGGSSEVAALKIPDWLRGRHGANSSGSSPAPPSGESAANGNQAADGATNVGTTATTATSPTDGTADADSSLKAMQGAANRSAGGKSAALSTQQRQLANLYGTEQEHTDATKIANAPTLEQRHEQVSDVAIMAAVTRYKKSVQACYERVLKHDESLRNLRVDVEVKVGLSGSVKNVSFGDQTVSDSDLGRCLTQAIRHWHFPSQDSEYQTAFPLLLQAQ